MADASTFARRLGQIGANVKKNADKLVQRAATAIATRLVISTQVDRGGAAPHWRASLHPPRALTAPTSAEATPAAARSVISLRIATHRAAMIYLSTDDSQRGEPNAGRGAQGPPEFVANAVSGGVATVKGARLLGRDTEVVPTW